MIKIVKKSLSGSTKFVETILFEVEDAKTRAAGILLRNYLEEQDEDYINQYRVIHERIKFSRNYLEKVLKEKGTIKCTYCSKEDLVIEYDGMKVPNKIKATIDHILPKSRGGAHFDLRNITPCCGTCNTNKGSRLVEDFLKYK